MVRVRKPSHPLIFQCSSCKTLVPLRQFQTTASSLQLHCVACDVWIEIANPSEKVDVVPSEPSLAKVDILPSPSAEMPLKEPVGGLPAAVVAKSVASSTLSTDIDGSKRQCPKCDHWTEKEREECPKCGLAFSNIGVTFQLGEDGEEGTGSAEAMMIWQNQVLPQWKEPAAHERFLLFCQTHELYEQAARLYRREQQSRDDDTLASTYLARIVELVQIKFMHQTTESESMSKRTGRWKVWLVMGMLLVGGLFLYVIFRSMHGPGLP